MDKNTSLKKNMAWNVARQACAVVFPFLIFAHSSRVLGAGQMGAYAFGQSVTGYFTLVAMMGIPDYATREAAALRGSDKKLERFVNEVFSMNLCTTALAYIFLFLLLGVWGRLHPYRYVILIQSIQMFLAAVGADWVNTAFEDFFYLAVRYIVIEAACTAAVLLLVKSPKDLYVYTFLLMLSAAGGNIWNVFYIRRYVKIRPVFHVDIKKHLPSMLALLCNNAALVIYLNSDMTLIGLLRNDSEAGIYAVATKIYLIAKALINAAIMAVVPRLSYLAACGQLGSYNKKLSKLADNLLLFILPISVYLFMEAEGVIWFTAGNGYLEGAAVLRIYCVTIVFAVFSCFASYAVLMPLHLEKYFACATVPAAALNVGLNFWLIPAWGIEGAAVTTFVSEAVVFLLAFHFAGKRMHVKICWNDLMADVAGALAAGMICLMVRLPGMDLGMELCLAAVLAVPGYVIVLLCTKNRTFQELAGWILKITGKRKKGCK